MKSNPILKKIYSSNINWYKKHCLIKEAKFYNQSGSKINKFLLGAIALVLMGTSIDIASKKMNVPKETIEESLRDTEILEITELFIEESQNFHNFVFQKQQEPVTQIDPSDKKDPVSPIVPSTPSKSTDVNINLLVDAVIQLEGSSVTHIGGAGDTGVMQMRRLTWEDNNWKKQVGLQNKYPYEQYKFNKNVQIEMGTAYLRYLNMMINKAGNQKGSVPYLILVAYNGGLGTVIKGNYDPDQIRKRNPRAHDYAERGCNLSGYSVFRN
jgi:hypothetical protein